MDWTARLGEGSRGRPGARRGWCWPAALLVCVFCLCCQGAGATPLSLPLWRSALGQLRGQIENNAAEAYRQAVRLQETPAGTSAAERNHGLNMLARSELYLARSEAAGEHAELALAHAVADGDAVGQAEADLVIALNAVNQGRIERMMLAANDGVRVLDGVDRPDLLAEAMLRMAMMYNRLGKLDESIELCARTLEIAKRSGAALALAYGHQGMAISFSQSGNASQAQQHYEQMLKAARAYGSRVLEADALGGLAGVAGLQGNWRDSERGLREVVRIYGEMALPYYQNAALHSLASNLRKQGRDAEAVELFNRIVANLAERPNRIFTWWTLSARAETFLALGDLAAAEADLLQARRLAGEVGLPLYVAENARRLGALAARRGNQGRAYRYMVEAAALVAKANADKVSARVLELTKRYAAESERRHIDELTRHNASQRAELEHRAQQQRWLWIVLCGSGLALLAILVMLMRLRRSHQLLGRLNGALDGSRRDLQRQTEILQSILDSMGDGVVVTDARGMLVLVNPAAERLAQLHELGDGVWRQRGRLYLPDRSALYPPQDLPLARAARGEACDGIELYAEGEAGAEGLWLSATGRPLTGRDGVPRGAMTVFSDFSARKRAEDESQRLNAELELKVRRRTAELRQQRHYLRVLIDTLPWRVWFKDTASRYLAVNRAMARSWNRGVDSMVGLSDTDIMPLREEAEEVVRDDLAVMATRSAHTAEQMQPTSYGMAWEETFKAPVLDDDGTVLGTVGFSRDISERKQIEAARDAALAEARHLAALRSEFLAQMSHELRTPLNGILGYAQILQRDASLGERQLAGVEVIRRSGSHLLTMINDVLDAAKIEAGKLEPQADAVPLVQCVQALGETVRLQAEHKQLRFVCEVDPAVPAMVQVDERRLRQALLNLLANAVKFTDQGMVRLRVGPAAAGRLRFEVVDTGIGIAPGFFAQIFEPFEQVGDAARRQGGTGLGLAISRQFVRLLGGEIAVESAPGGGSRFWFELALPVLDMAAPAVCPARRPVGYAGARRRLLLAGGPAEERRLLFDMLQPLGFELAEAADGAAVAHAARWQPDLVLAALDTPERAALARWPLIGLARSGAAAGAAPDAVAAVLGMPLDYEQLLERVGALLRLDWQWQEADGVAAEPAAEEQRMVVPPAAEMVSLHHLAQLGDMGDILAHAEHLFALDPSYRPFAAQLRRLARGYQSQAVLRLVEQYLEAE